MKCCNAILDFQDGNFVCCELEEGHMGNHRALMFEWEGEGTTKCHSSYRLRGGLLLKCKMERELSKRVKR